MYGCTLRFMTFIWIDAPKYSMLFHKLFWNCNKSSYFSLIRMAKVVWIGFMAGFFRTGVAVVNGKIWLHFYRHWWPIATGPMSILLFFTMERSNPADSKIGSKLNWSINRMWIKWWNTWPREWHHLQKRFGCLPAASRPCWDWLLGKN